MRKALLTVFAVILLAGCSTTFQAVPIDSATGRFPTSSKLEAGELVTQKPFDTRYRKLLYIKTSSLITDKENKYFVDSFKNINEFEKVLDTDELQAMVINLNISSQVQNISDNVGLHNLAGVIGPFLIVEFHLEKKLGYNYEADLKATDAATGMVVFEAKREAFNFSGLDQPLFFPLFNAFIDWSKNGNRTG